MSHLTDPRVKVLERSNDTSVIVVDSLSDLPDAVANVRTLANSTVYIISGTITLNNNERIVAGLNTVIMGYSRDRDAIVGNVAGSLISVPTAEDSLDITEVALTQNNAGGTILDTVDSTLNRLSLRGVTMTAAGGNLGSIGADVLLVRELRATGFAVGLTITGAGHDIASFERCLISQTTGTGGNPCLDFGTSTWNLIAIDHITLISAASGFALSGAASNGNFVNTDGRGSVSDVQLLGAGTPLENITIDDLQWHFVNNDGVPASSALGSYSMEGNATATTISASSTYTVIAGTTVAEEERRFEHTASNQLTYRGRDTSMAMVQAVLAINKSGAATAFEFAVFVNGSKVGAASTREVTTVTSSITILATADLNQNDVIDIRMQNLVNTDDATVVNMSVVVRGTL